MQVVILAGGLGTRIKSVAPDLPKSLIPIHGLPFIDYQFELLKRHGLTDVVLCIGFHGDQIVDHVGDGAKFGVRVRYAEEDPNQLLGTGGAVVNALPMLAKEFVILYGDSYLPVDYSGLVTTYRSCGCQAMMTVIQNGGQWDASNARVEGDRVVFYSKSARPEEADWIDYGLTFLQRDVIESYADLEMPLDMGRIQGELVDQKQMAAQIMEQRFYEIGKPEGLADLEQFLAAAERFPRESD